MGTELIPTMSPIQKLCEVHGAAGGPGQVLVQMDKERSHHVVFSQGSKEPLTGLGVVMGHAEHMSWKRREPEC